MEIESYSSSQLENIIQQRLMYAYITYENQSVLKNIVKYGKHDLNKCIRLMKSSVMIMQSQGRRILLMEDINNGARMNRIEYENDDDIPF